MSCEHAQRELLELPAWRFAEIAHLAGCEPCRSRAEAIQRGQESLRAEVQSFVGGGDLQAVLERARRSRARTPRWHSAMLLLAAAAVLWVVARGIVGQPVVPALGGPEGTEPEEELSVPVEEGGPVAPRRLEQEVLEPDALLEVPDVPPEALEEPQLSAPPPLTAAEAAATLRSAGEAYVAGRFAESEGLAVLVLANAQAWDPESRARVQASAWELRAMSAYRLWMLASDAHRNRPTDTTNAREGESRRHAVVLGREWLAFARSTGLPLDRPFNVCMSAAGGRAACLQ